MDVVLQMGHHRAAEMVHQAVKALQAPNQLNETLAIVQTAHRMQRKQLVGHNEYSIDRIVKSKN